MTVRLYPQHYNGEARATCGDCRHECSVKAMLEAELEAGIKAVQLIVDNWARGNLAQSGLATTTVSAGTGN